MRKFLLTLLAASLLLAHYPTVKEINAKLFALQKKHPELVKLEKIYDGVYAVRLALKGKIAPGKRPALFVGANLEGDRLLTTYTALQLIEKIASTYQKDQKLQRLLKTRTIYVAPLLNPYAYSFYFRRPKREFNRNRTRWDDDRDGVADEDPPEDINGDGLITMMRVKDPEGKYIPDPKDPRIMRKADPLKGERGIYKLYTEGIDNDGDGKINEDDIGGVNLEKNFPHAWKPHQNDGGLWPVSEKETRAIVEFFFKHRNIAAAYTYSAFNNLLQLPPQRGPKAVGEMRVKVPKRFARFLNVDPNKEYTINELVKILKGMPFARGMEITPEMVASFLGVGPTTTINRQDMKIYQKLSKEFKDFLKKKGALTEGRLKPPGDGSMELWLYFQYGVLSFTSDVWRIPPAKKPKKEDLLSKLEKMSPEEFVKLGKEKIQKMLKEMGAPPSMKAEMVIQMVKSGRITPAQMAKFARRAKKGKAEGQEADILAWSDKVLGGKGFVPWKPFKHPTLGEVEIGGFVPFITKAPPVDKVKKEVEAHNEFALKILEMLPQLRIEDIKTEKMAKNIYKITLYVANDGIFPTATAHASRSRLVMPVLADIELSGGKLLYGKTRERIGRIEGKSVAKLTWIVEAKKGSRVKIKVFHEKAGYDEKSVTLR